MASMSNVSNDLILTGPDAFYNDKSSVENTKKALSLTSLPPVTYSCTLENRIYRIAKEIFSYIFFPIIIYRAFHALTGWAFIIGKSYKGDISFEDLERKGWKINHITIEVDGSKIQTVIMGKPDTLGNGRWTIHSGRGDEVTGNTLGDDSFRDFLEKVNSNAILFNAPDVLVGAWPNKTTYKKAYRAMLQFLENKLQAKEIICHGVDIGGGFQAEALDAHTFKDNVKYVCIKDRTFSTSSKFVRGFTEMGISRFFISFLVSLSGWNIDIASASKRLKQKEIIIQVTNNNATSLEKSLPSKDIKHDEAVSPEASLAYSLSEDPNKIFLGLKGNYKHDTYLEEDMPILTAKVNELLSSNALALKN